MNRCPSDPGRPGHDLGRNPAPRPDHDPEAEGREPRADALGFVRLGELLPGVPEAGSLDKTPSPRDRACPTPRVPSAARLVSEVWPQAVGAEIAANARPVSLRRGRLVVSTSSPAWAQTLELLGEQVLARLNERLYGLPDTERPKKIVFRHAGWEEWGRPPAEGGPGQSAARPPSSGGAEAPAAGAAPGPHSRARLTEEQRQALEEVESMDLPSAFKQALLQAMLAAFVRGKKDFVR